MELTGKGLFRNRIMKKALSIKQPWASLIAHGIKDIENRAWKTNYRGKILIHVSAKPSKMLWELLSTEQYKIAMNYFSEVKNREFFTSVIIGEVEIIDCVINHPSIWAEKSEGEIVGHTFFHKENQKPTYNWVLANAKLYDEPIYNVKGKLSIWNYERNII